MADQDTPWNHLSPIVPDPVPPCYQWTRAPRRFPAHVPDSPSNALGSAYAPGLIDPWPLLLSIEMGLSGL